MLWDLIRDFFVQHVFGGVASNFDEYSGFIGMIWTADDGGDILTTNSYSGSPFKLGNYSVSMGDWLSTTATAISITIIVVLCCMFVYKIIKLIGGLIR